MKGVRDVTRRMGAVLVGLLTLGLGAPAAAQDVFSLPAGTAAPTARPAGPVDAEAPVVRPRPTQSATPQPSATPTAAPAATTATTAAPRQPTARQPAARRPAPAASAAAAADPLALPGAATPAPIPTPTPTGAFPTAIPTLTPAPAASATTPATAAAPASDWSALVVGALLGALALLALVGGLIWRRRKSDAAPSVDFEPPLAAAARPEPQPAPAQVPDSAPAQPAPVAAPEPVPAPPPEGLHITLEARRLDASLVATTLVYQLRLTNHGEVPLSALAIEGDMIAAHSSLPVEQQIANTEQRLELRHALVALAPGESAEFKGELRLPLAAITPIRAGNAAYFVPLVRLRVEAAQGADETLVIAQTFVIGELPQQPGGALRPFRLDLGPRTFGKVSQRAVG
ncbi:MAG: hypothetical protein RL339_2061 [Pseudomonadota bacterium]